MEMERRGVAPRSPPLPPAVESALCQQFQQQVALQQQQLPQPATGQPLDHRLQHLQLNGEEEAVAPATWHGRPVEQVATHYQAEQFTCRFEMAMRLEQQQQEDARSELSGAMMEAEMACEEEPAGAEDPDFHAEHGSELCFLLNNFSMDGKSPYMPYIC